MADNPIVRPAEPGRRGDDVALLTEFLDYFRTVLLRKAGGLDPDQLQVRIEPSTLTLGRLLRHMAFVEHWWFHEVFAGKPALEPWASADWAADQDWEMTTAADMTFDELRAGLEAAWAASRAVVDQAGSFDQLATGGDANDRVSLRWIHVHLIEEYARHCGHADLLRETIDGALGD